MQSRDTTIVQAKSTNGKVTNKNYLKLCIRRVKDIVDKIDELRVVNKDKTLLNNGYEKANWQVKATIPEAGTAGKIKDGKAYYEKYIYPFGVTVSDAQREQTPMGDSSPAVLKENYLYGASQANNKNADLVNREFFDRVNGYVNIIMTDRLSTKKYKSENYYSIQQSNAPAYTFGLVAKVLNAEKKKIIWLKLL